MIKGEPAMTKDFATMQAELKRVKFTPLLPEVLEVDTMAKIALTKTLETLTRRMELVDVETVVNRLRHGDQSVWYNFHYHLSVQLAEQLGALDEGVKAVYIDEYDISPEDLAFGETARTTVICLIVWVQRKTDALKSLVVALDRALVQGFLDLIGQPRLKHLLEVEVIDDAEAKKPFGYGAFLSSTCFPLTEIWRREGADLELILSQQKEDS
jgi:hypothetical protein